MDHRLWSENVEYGCSPGSRQGRRDGDRVLSSTELARQGCDREGRRTLSGSHSYRRRHPCFPCITAGQGDGQAACWRWTTQRDRTG